MRGHQQEQIKDKNRRYIHVLQENTVWEGGVYARVAVPRSDSDGAGSSGVNVTLAVALSICLVAAVVVVGVAAKYIQRKVCRGVCRFPLH